MFAAVLTWAESCALWTIRIDSQDCSFRVRRKSGTASDLFSPQAGIEAQYFFLHNRFLQAYYLHVETAMVKVAACGENCEVRRL
jgi:hypothetical protein